MTITRCALPALLALAALGCSQRQEEPPPATPGGLETDLRPSTVAAWNRMDEFDRRLAAIEALPPAKRLAAQRDLGPELERLAEAVADTRFENKAQYLLAHWRFNFAPRGAGVDQALDRLEGCRAPALKQAGRALRVQQLLRQGRLVQARRSAEALALEADQWRGVVELVDLYARIGRPAPATTGLDAGGRAVEVLAETAGAWRVVLIGATVTDMSVFQVRRYLDAAAAAPRPVRVAALATDSSAQLIAARAGEVPGALLLWTDTAERAEAWRRDWGQPVGTPLVALVDPQGRIAAFQFGPDELPALVAPAP
ncbi:MAG: hypothetical protein L6R48_21945 [Planctomycetes bacterium]|nr:hypothetical protein [Planctomycetota bacterium]